VKNNPTLLLVGGGGHCKSCIDVIENGGKYKIAGIVEKKDCLTESVLGYPVIGNDSDLPSLFKKHPQAFITVGQIKNPDLRIKLYVSLKKMSANLPIIISSLAYVSRYASLEEGTIVMHGAILNAGSSIGVNCIINSQALIEHDVVVEAHCHISTGAIVNGGVFIGEKSFIGSGSVIHEGIRIGEKCVVAAGSVIYEDLPDETLFRKNS
jgi:sugar O-acyltransferase (sialic acid O-acetyltransferase NeuD family)